MMRFILRCRVRLLDLIKSNGDKKNTDETAQLGKQSADQIKRGKVWAALVRLYQLKVAVGSWLTLGTSTKIYLHVYIVHTHINFQLTQPQVAQAWSAIYMTRV